MELDRSKSYGQIWGHPSATFEQNGQLFDGAGEWIPPEEPEEGEETVEMEVGAEAFVREILAGGPVAQAAVYKESQLRELDWDAVKNAAKVLSVAMQKDRGVMTWQLNPT